MISLSIQNITDEIFALTALQSLQDSSMARPAVLSRDQLPALRILVRNAFSVMVSRLTPFISDVNTEEGNPDAQLPYNSTQTIMLNIDFGNYIAGMTTGQLLLLRRQLEHLLAIETLAAVCPAIPVPSIPSLYESIIDTLLMENSYPPLPIRPYDRRTSII